MVEEQLIEATAVFSSPCKMARCGSSSLDVANIDSRLSSGAISTLVSLSLCPTFDQVAFARRRCSWSDVAKGARWQH